MSAESARANRAYLERELTIVLKQIERHAKVYRCNGAKRPRWYAIQRLCLQAFNICKRLGRGRGESWALNFHWHCEEEIRRLGKKPFGF